jgi:ribosome modulation factor
VVKQAADDITMTKWSRRDLFAGAAAGTLGVVAAQSLGAARDRLIGAWTAGVGGGVMGRTHSMCDVCEVRGASYDGRFCSSLCGWASVFGGKIREGRKRDVQTAVREGRPVHGG